MRARNIRERYARRRFFVASVLDNPPRSLSNWTVYISTKLAIMIAERSTLKTSEAVTCIEFQIDVRSTNGRTKSERWRYQLLWPESTGSLIFAVAEVRSHL